jgi:hypothetical protein
VAASTVAALLAGGGLSALAAPAAHAQTTPSSEAIRNFLVANNLLKFEQAAYWHVVGGEMVFAKDFHTAAAPVTHAAASSYVPATGSNQGVWACIRQHESGGNYAENTGNGYYGAYQFSQQTWNGLGYSGNPANASPATQDAAAQKLQSESGWGPWPNTSRMCGV